MPRAHLHHTQSRPARSRARRVLPAIVAVSLLMGAPTARAAQVGTTSTASATSEMSMWAESSRPAVRTVRSVRPHSLGTRFQVTEPGEVTRLRFYKSVRNTGAHTGRLWTGSGRLLASVQFRNETRWGWQSATLDAPVRLTPGQTYVVSYTVSAGHFSRTPTVRGSRVGNGAIQVLGGSYGPESGFPHHRVTSVYYADVEFAPDSTPPPGSDPGTPDAGDPPAPGDGPSAPPTTRGCASDPSSCGYADASTTGPVSTSGLRAVPGDLRSGPGWHYDPRGWITVDGNGAVVENIRTNVAIDVNASDVTIRNNDIQAVGDSWGVALRTGARITITHNNIYSPYKSGSNRMLVGIKDIYGTVSDVSVTHNDIWHASTAIQMDSGLVSDNYVHDLGFKDGDHTNGIMSTGGTDRMVIRHNTVLNQYGQTDAIGLFQDFGKQANKVIDDNLVGGGGYSIYAGANPGKEASATSITVTNNRFASSFYPNSGYWGPATAYRAGGGNTWSDNYFDQTGKEVPAP